MTDPGRERIEQLTADLSRRLRRACAYLSDAEFDALVRKIAATTYRLERRQFERKRTSGDPGASGTAR